MQCQELDGSDTSATSYFHNMKRNDTGFITVQSVACTLSAAILPTCKKKSMHMKFFFFESFARRREGKHLAHLPLACSPAAFFLFSLMKGAGGLTSIFLSGSLCARYFTSPRISSLICFARSQQKSWITENLNIMHFCSVPPLSPPPPSAGDEPVFLERLSEQPLLLINLFSIFLSEVNELCSPQSWFHFPAVQRMWRAERAAGSSRSELDAQTVQIQPLEPAVQQRTDSQSPHHLWYYSLHTLLLPCENKIGHHCHFQALWVIKRYCNKLMVPFDHKGFVLALACMLWDEEETHGVYHASSPPSLCPLTPDVNTGIQNFQSFCGCKIHNV